LLEEFLKTHKYDPARKYRANNFGDFSVLYEPMGYMDVSPDPPDMSLSLLPKLRAPWFPPLRLTPLAQSRDQSLPACGNSLD
jgi:hypothetical protein